MPDPSQTHKGADGPAPQGRASTEVVRRSTNERQILSLLRNSGPKAKAEIARVTGLSAQSASVITRRLEQEGLIERCKPVRGRVGQPSVPFDLAAEGALFFGLKVGRRSADLLLVDFLGEVIARRHVTYRYPAPDATLAFVRRGVAEVTGGLTRRQRRAISGLGIAMPGYLWEWATIIDAPPDRMNAWRDRDICDEIGQLFDFPVCLQNDASCACGAELVFGDRAYPGEFMYFYVGYFIGGGVVLNGGLLTGPTGNAGAFGPMPVCGAGGQVRQLVDIASLSRLERALVSVGGDAEALWEDASNWSVAPRLLGEWLDEAADGLAHAIVAACSVIDFQLVVIDGWLPDGIRRDLVGRVVDAIPKFNLAGLVRPEVSEGTIGPNARSLGAASLPLSQQFLL